MQPAPEYEPTWAAVVRDVPTDLGDDSEGVADSVDWSAGLGPHYGDLVGRKAIFDGKVAVSTFDSAETQEAPGHRDEERQSFAEGVKALELTSFVGTTGLEGFEEFFDDPATSVHVDYGQDSLRRVDRLAGEEHPLDGQLALRRRRLRDIDYVDLDTLRDIGGKLRRPLNRHGRCPNFECSYSPLSGAISLAGAFRPRFEFHGTIC